MLGPHAFTMPEGGEATSNTILNTHNVHAKIK
jgi:hypothetical protein